jgi:thiosulfate/3-mercaptopyruvate sulfurtransferase
MESLVSTGWLAENLDNPQIAIVDASAHLPSAGRDPRAEYADAHIRGAVFLDLPSLFDSDSTVPSALPSAGQFAARMEQLGISDSAQIVLYDDSAVKSSARAWYMFRMFGHSDVAILDGGLAKWKAEGRPLTDADAACPPVNYSVRGENRSGVRSKSDMLANIDSRAAQVVDARDAGRFTGETPDLVHNLPGGHIPGARSLPFTELYDTDGTFKGTQELSDAFAAAGLDPAAPLVASCGSGVTACVILFAMHLLAHDHGELYDGSWSEWGADPTTPKETGEAR